MNISVLNSAPASVLRKVRSRRFNCRHAAAVVAALAVICCLATAVQAQSPLDGFDPRANNSVDSIAVQADGKILIGGRFTTLSPNGGGLTVTRNRLARLNPDGTLDAAFNPNPNHVVVSIAVQADEKILIGGSFTALSPNGGTAVTRNRIARLNKDGTLDASFNPKANMVVFSIVVQADARILIGGSFNSLSPNGGAAVTRNHIARLNPNGLVDASFNPNAGGPNLVDAVQSIALQADGKILIGGLFKSLSPNGGATVTRNRIARLNKDGTPDASFNPNANDQVRSIAVQADGKILIGGLFKSLSPNGGVAVTRNRIARLNPDGTLDASFNPNANSAVDSIAVQADGRTLIGGDFTGLWPNGGAPVKRNNIARLNPDGTLDVLFDPNASKSGSVPGPPGIQSIAVQADGKILIGGDFTTLSPSGTAAVTRNRIARLHQNGSIDQTLNINDFNHEIFVTAVQPDGKILIGGHFNMVLGVTRNNIVRLNPNGTLDASFDPNANKDPVISIAVQADGKILISGAFTSLSPHGGAAVKRNGVARLNPNGTLDVSFDPNPNANPDLSPNFSHVETIAVQADGKILIGGPFTSLSPNGGAAVKRNGLARLNPDGTLDALFDPNPNSAVVSIMVQADGKILIGGDFTSLSPNGGAAVTRNCIARLNPDGTLDVVFDPNASKSGPQSSLGGVQSIVVQANGKILISGNFTSLSPNGGAAVTRNRIARLNPDGTLDASFPNLSNSPMLGVHSISVQADGKILIGGGFTTLSPDGGAAVTRNGIARLHPDGKVDASFDPNANPGLVIPIAVQADGKILIGGGFTSLSPNGGAAFLRKFFARLSNNTAALQNLAVTKTKITWTRGGASPQLDRVTFEQSTDGGVTYTFLGNGVRVGTTSNFSLTGLNLPAVQNILIRARGVYGGARGRGESITESLRNAYLF